MIAKLYSGIHNSSIARSLMYKRNAELAKAGVVDLADYKPKKYYY